MAYVAVDADDVSDIVLLLLCCTELLIPFLWP